MPAMTDPIRFYDRALSRLTRRELLNIAWKLGLAAIVPPVLSDRVLAQPLFRSYPFPLGVASGDPWPDSVVLWTRLAPEPLDGGGMPMANVEVGWEMAPDRAFRNIVHKGTAVARPELGHSVHVEAAGLQPGREYFYRFHCGAEVSQIGRTKTAPAEGAAVDSLRFAVCGCSHYETGYFTAFRRIAAENFDFVFHTGDYIYEARADSGKNPAVVRQHRGDEIYTVVDYRNRYALYKSDPDLRAAHAAAPFIVTWDDHEVDNDYAGDMDEGNTPPELFLLRRAAAYQAYYETMPLRASTLPTGPSMRLYRRLRFGRLIDFTVLDTRQFRSNQACNGVSATGCTDAWAPTRTILGAEQERWLFEQLGNARATWTVLGQQVPTFARDMVRAAPNAQFSMDKWDGYGAARQRLYARLRETRAAESDRAVGRRARPLWRRPQAGLHRSAIGDRRRRVHEHLDHLRRRRRRSGCHLGSDPPGQPAHQVPQRAPRLYRLHRDADRDACRLQGAGSRHDSRCARSEPAGRWCRGGTSRRVDGVTADALRLPQRNHRILAAGPTRRQPRRSARDHQQRHHRGAERERIDALDAEQQALGKPRQRRGSAPARRRPRSLPAACRPRAPTAAVGAACRPGPGAHRTHACGAPRRRPQRHRCQSPRAPARRARTIR